MKGKKVLSVLLASVMMFTAVPVGSIGAMAAPVQNAQVQEQKVKTQAESGLSNIAADCEMCEKNSAEIRIRPYTVERGCITEVCTEQRNERSGQCTWICKDCKI